MMLQFAVNIIDKYKNSNNLVTIEGAISFVQVLPFCTLQNEHV